MSLSVTPGSGTTALVTLPPSLFAPLHTTTTAAHDVDGATGLVTAGMAAASASPPRAVADKRATARANPPAEHRPAPEAPLRAGNPADWSGWWGPAVASAMPAFNPAPANGVSTAANSLGLTANGFDTTANSLGIPSRQWDSMAANSLGPTANGFDTTANGLGPAATANGSRRNVKGLGPAAKGTGPAPRAPARQAMRTAWPPTAPGRPPLGTRLNGDANGPAGSGAGPAVADSGPAANGSGRAPLRRSRRKASGPTQARRRTDRRTTDGHASNGPPPPTGSARSPTVSTRSATAKGSAPPPTVPPLHRPGRRPAPGPLQPSPTPTRPLIVDAPPVPTAAVPNPRSPVRSTRPAGCAAASPKPICRPSSAPRWRSLRSRWSAAGRRRTRPRRCPGYQASRRPRGGVGEQQARRPHVPIPTTPRTSTNTVNRGRA